MLIDTNVISELVRPEPEPRVSRWMGEQRFPALSVITLDEISFGFAARPKPRAEAAITNLIETHFRIIDINAEIARLAGAMRGGLRKSGVQITQADALIAATAKTYGLALATRNTQDFAAVPIHIVNPWAEDA